MSSYSYSKIVWICYILAIVISVISFKTFFVETFLLLLSAVLFYKKNKKMIDLVNWSLLAVLILHTAIQPPRNIVICLAEFSLALFLIEATRTILKFEKLFSLKLNYNKRALREKIWGILKLITLSYILSVIALVVAMYSTFIPPHFIEVTLTVVLLITFTYFILPYSYKRKRKSNTPSGS